MKIKYCLIILIALALVVCNKNKNQEISVYEKKSSYEKYQKKMYVNASSGLRVRSMPSTDSERVGLLENGTEVIVVKEELNTIVINDVQGKWALINSPIEGWVFTGFLSEKTAVSSSEVLRDFDQIISYFEKHCNFGKLGSAKSIDEFIKIFGVIGNNKTINYEKIDIAGLHGNPPGTYIDKYVIEDGPYKLVVWYYSSLISLEIKLDESNFISLFPYRTLDEYLSDGGFGSYTFKNNDGFTGLQRHDEEGWTLLFRNGILYKIAYYQYFT